MLIVTRDTILNSQALEMRSLPRKFLGRVTLWPAGGGFGLWLRVVFEVEVWRYVLALSPFVIAALIWQDYALAIAQAPLPMLIVVYLVESRFLRVPRAKRADLVDKASAERGLDLLRARAQSILTKIAAGRGLSDGRLHLVVEQSDIARIPPLTYVSVQSEDGPAILRLTPEERSLITGSLFQPPLTEKDLLRINIAQDQPLRDIALEASKVSAHARMAALMAQR